MNGQYVKSIDRIKEICNETEKSYDAYKSEEKNDPERDFVFIFPPKECDVLTKPSHNMMMLLIGGYFQIPRFMLQPDMVTHEQYMNMRQSESTEQ